MSASPVGAGAGSTAHVTLLTGDRIGYTELADGRRMIQVDPAPRPGRPAVTFLSTGSGDKFFVLPSDTVPYVAAGVLDWELFDVKGLVREGLTDQASMTLPVIVAFRGRPAPPRLAAEADALPASHRTRSLPVIHAAALRVDRGSAWRFWDALDGGRPLGRAGPLVPKDRAFEHNVAQVWLDGKVTVADDVSDPQIGAPAVWAAGYDGTGVTAAVLDTGIDASHPDLVGKVVGAANFSDDTDTTDHFGHGTHVASIIAGTGAASGGKYVGVAPGAKLLNGKVLDGSGFGLDSGVIAGMDWAAHAGAKVINMSLGGLPTDGTDPLAQAADTLTTQTGALFVVAAGNGGALTSVASPGAAAAAMTVGAVDKTGTLAWFSSRGPRLGDAAVKPNITAPGVGIVAARAAGTSMGTLIDQYYTTASGTSMATPHVAGAAALLAQARPTATATGLKDALASTAADGGYPWFVQGAGRVDVARAVAQQVYGPASVDFGREPRTASATKRLTYTNRGSAAVTLRLAVSLTGWNGTPAPRGVVRLSTPTLRVPAAGKADVDLTIDPTLTEPGAYGGVVTAATTDSAISTRTPVSVYTAPDTVQLTVRVTDFQGKPMPYGVAAVTNLAFNTVNDPFIPPTSFVTVQDGVGTTRVINGTYNVLAQDVAFGLQVRRVDVMTVPEAPVSGDTVVTLDARAGTPLRAATAQPTDELDHTVNLTRTAPGGVVVVLGLPGRTGESVYVTPTAPVTLGHLELDDFWTLEQALVDMRVQSPQPVVLHPAYDTFTGAPKLAGDRVLPVVFAGQGDFRGIDAKGKLALVAIDAPPGTTDLFGYLSQAVTSATANAAQAGAAAIVLYVDTPGALSIPTWALPGGPIAQLALSNAEGDLLRQLLGQGEVTVALRGRAHPAYVYNLLYLTSDAIPAVFDRQVDPATLVRVPTRYHADQPGLFYVRWFAAVGPHGGVFAPIQQKFWAPAAWDEYYGPASDQVVWVRRIGQVSIGKKTTNQSGMHTPRDELFRAGGAVLPEERWFSAPVTYGAPDLDYFRLRIAPCLSFCREGDVFIPAVQAMDPAGHYLRAVEAVLYNSTLRLYRDGVQVPVIPPGFAGFDGANPTYRLAPEPATYRLEEDNTPPVVRPDDPEAIYTTVPHVATTWTFHSSRPTGGPPAGYVCWFGSASCALQPLIMLHYQLDLDLYNQAPAGGPFTFAVRAGPHPAAAGAAPVAGLTLSYSTDDGHTWSAAQVAPLGDGRYQITVNHPDLNHTRRSVWLRTEAWDTDGNRVQQIVQHAYTLTTTLAN